MKLLFIFTLISLLLPVWAQPDDFPWRAAYFSVEIYETDQLYESLDDVIIIDVRSTYEFDILHINNALNIPLNSKTFIDQVKKLQSEARPVVFYCSGHACYKSYKAVEKAQRAKLTNVFAYDSGIFDWTNAYPEKAVLLGKTPVDKSLLLGKEDLKKNLLTPEKFTAKINDNAVILDIREPVQRGMLELFPYQQHNISMGEQEKLNKFLTGIKKSGKTLLVYDEAGKQVTWLQYHLKDKRISNYFFMAGGINKFLETN